MDVFKMIEHNAVLREQNAILSCLVIVMTVLWAKEKIKRLQEKEKSEDKGE